RRFRMSSLSQLAQLKQLRILKFLRQLNRASPIPTRRTCGHWALEDRELRLPGLTRASAGRIMRLSRITAVGTDRTSIMITIGTTPSTTALATLAEMIRLSLAMTTVMALIRQALGLAMMALVIRSGWRRARSGSVVVTWTRATAHRRDTSNAWNFSLHPTL